MNIKKVQSVSLELSENVGGYEAVGVATVKEDGSVEVIQSGRILKDGNAVINFTSWNESHLSFDTNDVKAIKTYLDTVIQFCSMVRDNPFAFTAQIVEPII